MNNHKKQRGFTLPEILIGISVLLIAIITASNLIVGITRSNQANMNDLTAYYLASEGVEAVRNIRDSQWIHNLKWTGDSNYNFWARGTGIDFADVGTYIISRKPKSNFSSVGDAKQKVQAAAPWIVSKISESDKKKDLTKLYLLEASGAKQFMHASHQGLLNGAGSFSDRFSRYVDVKLVDKSLEVKSVVTWDDKGTEKQVSLEAVLTDWKSGPS